MSGGFVVKLRLKGRKRFDRMLGSGGRTTRLKVHAIQFGTEHLAMAAAVRIVADNPEFLADAKVVAL